MEDELVTQYRLMYWQLNEYQLVGAWDEAEELATFMAKVVKELGYTPEA